jgi:uncharacterized protein (DUF2235 family)
MALYAFDGTGNEDEDVDSNVLEFFRAYDDPHKNDDLSKPVGSLYLKGIGTRAQTKTGMAVSEALGIGGHDRVRDAIHRLRSNMASGDQVIDVVGFSRGAALAISFANRVAATVGPAEIRFIGVWDIVGQFGLPGEHHQAGHHLEMPAHVGHCYHAMALDESRHLFPLTRLARAGSDPDPRLVEVWFRGVHSDVGGGNGNRGLNWIALHWMFQAALRHGLPIAASAVAANLVHRALAQQISDHKLDLEVVRQIRATDLLHTTVRLEAGSRGRPHNNPAFALARIDDDGTVTPASA